jgi:hypothetical protein
MTTLRIHDLADGVLALDLRDLLCLLAPQSMEAIWTISTVKCGSEWFEATGQAGKELEALAQEDTRMLGTALLVLAEKTHQVIWGEFKASRSSRPDETWVTVRAVDSSFFEVTSHDEMVLNAVTTSFNDVRLVDATVA